MNRLVPKQDRRTNRKIPNNGPAIRTRGQEQPHNPGQTNNKMDRVNGFNGNV